MYNWNEINLDLLILSDTSEINKLYKYTKPFFIGFFKDNEELYNDLFMCILNNIGSFDPNKGLFSNWIYTIAVNKRNNHYQQQKKQLRTQSIDFITEPLEYLDYENWNTQEKQELETRLDTLLPTEQTFVEWYLITPDRKSMQQRQRYSRLVKKLSK